VEHTRCPESFTSRYRQSTPHFVANMRQAMRPSSYVTPSARRCNVDTAHAFTAYQMPPNVVLFAAFWFHTLVRLFKHLCSRYSAVYATAALMLRSAESRVASAVAPIRLIVMQARRQAFFCYMRRVARSVSTAGECRRVFMILLCALMPCCSTTNYLMLRLFDIALYFSCFFASFRLCFLALIYPRPDTSLMLSLG